MPLVKVPFATKAAGTPKSIPPEKDTEAAAEPIAQTPKILVLATSYNCK